mmetsp:Transcript_32237/g.94244  ORF Transcript_32237/g.94244 Transcript_32237/m.94244 type:complete len:714 (+) Transcript_32237:32-2173(+)
MCASAARRAPLAQMAPRCQPGRLCMRPPLALFAAASACLMRLPSAARYGQREAVGRRGAGAPWAGAEPPAIDGGAHADDPDGRYRDNPDRRHSDPGGRYEELPVGRYRDHPSRLHRDLPGESYRDHPGEGYRDHPGEAPSSHSGERYRDHSTKENRDYAAWGGDRDNPVDLSREHSDDLGGRKGSSLGGLASHGLGDDRWLSLVDEDMVDVPLDSPIGSPSNPSAGAGSGGGEHAHRGLRRAPAVAIGFANTGNSCYLAAALQVLLHTPPLLEFVLDEENLEPGVDPQLVALLKEIVDMYVTSASISETATLRISHRFEELKLNFEDQGDHEGSQQDAADVLERILGRYRAAFVPGFGRHITTTFAQDCDPEQGTNARRIDPVPGCDEWRDLPGDVCGHSRVQSPSMAVAYLAAFDGSSSVALGEALVSSETYGGAAGDMDLLDDNGAWETESVSEVKRVLYNGMYLEISKWEVEEAWVFPDTGVAMMRVNRHLWDPIRGAMKRAVAVSLGDNGDVQLPVMIGDQDHWMPFRLIGCTYYSGKQSYGHWTALTLVEGRGWYEFDDLDVRPVDAAVALRNCGEDGPFMVFARSSEDDPTLEVTWSADYDPRKSPPGASSSHVPPSPPPPSRQSPPMWTNLGPQWPDSPLWSLSADMPPGAHELPMDIGFETEGALYPLTETMQKGAARRRPSAAAGALAAAVSLLFCGAWLGCRR